MEKQIFLEKKHVSLSFCKSISNICEPLSQHFNVTFFDFCRVFNDGSFFNLTSKGEWLEHFYRNQYFLLGADKFNECIKSRYFLWTEMEEKSIPQKQFLEARNDFNIDHGVSIIEKHKDFYDIYNFAARRENYFIINFYLNNMDLLEKFTLYFRDKAQKLIQLSEANKITVGRIITQDSIGYCKDEPDFLYDLTRYLQTIEPKKYRIFDNNKEILLLKREFQCLQALARGKAIKKISGDLCLSPRTIEDFVSKLKDKLACNTKSMLIDKAEKLITIK
jgi:LuxR family transcriptional regulator, quorum-sensing system regulator SolR